MAAIPEYATLFPGYACRKIAIVTNNVEVDDHGYVYMTDRVGMGLHILEPMDDARKVANFRE
ncbi:MAG: hypothetical protein ABL891_10530 [Burkholderiales bacterium]